MKIHFSPIVICLILRSEILCTWARERKQRGSSVAKGQGWVSSIRRVEMGVGDGWLLFPYPTTAPWFSGVEGDWSKSGRPMTLEFMLCAFVCEHVCGHYAHMQGMNELYIVEWTRCTHAVKYVSVCVHMYIYAWGAPT